MGSNPPGANNRTQLHAARADTAGMRLLIAVIVGGLCTIPSGVAADAHARTLELVVGDQTSLPATHVKSFSEGAPGIVDVRLPRDGERFILLAQKAGHTTLLLLMEDGSQLHYRIDVTDQPPGNRPTVVRPRDNVRLDLYFVQVSDRYGHNLGVSWPSSLAANLEGSFDLMTGSFRDAVLSISGQVLPGLDMAQRSGWARLSRHAAVVAANEQPANYRSGGEINVPIQGALTAEIRALEYGSTIKVTPRFDARTGRVELSLGASVSDLLDDAGTGIPARTVSELQTTVNIDLGKSLVLAGLDARSDGRSKRGLPGLSRIPIVGGLFGSHNRRREEVKNLLFIVPTVVQAVSLRDRDRIREALAVYEAFDGESEETTLLEGPEVQP